jgi:ribosomal protein L7/L12
MFLVLQGFFVSMFLCFLKSTSIVFADFMLYRNVLFLKEKVMKMSAICPVCSAEIYVDDIAYVKCHCGLEMKIEFPNKERILKNNIRSAMRGERKIEAIKLYRSLTGKSLMDCRDIINLAMEAMNF